MNQKKIISFLIVFLFISFFYLAYVEKKQADLNYQKNWWVLSFDNPKDNTLNFSIENHSNKTNFHWEVMADGNILKEGDLVIIKGGKELRSEASELSSLSLENKKISVKVSADGEMKEIYKNF